jgi:hypothetical protein
MKNTLKEMYRMVRANLLFQVVDELF